MVIFEIEDKKMLEMVNKLSIFELSFSILTIMNDTNN